MEIRLTTPAPAFESQIQAAARTAGCYARVKRSWVQLGRRHLRFVLTDRPLSDRPASFIQHDGVLWALLQIDPGAEIRTAKAHFHGLADFEKQTGRLTTATDQIKIEGVK